MIRVRRDGPQFDLRVYTPTLYLFSFPQSSPSVISGTNISDTKGTPMTLPGKRPHPSPKENLYSDWPRKASFHLSEERCGSALLFGCFAEHPALGFKGHSDLLPFRRNIMTISNFVATKQMPSVPSSHHRDLNLALIFFFFFF